MKVYQDKTESVNGNIQIITDGEYCTRRHSMD